MIGAARRALRMEYSRRGVSQRNDPRLPGSVLPPMIRRCMYFKPSPGKTGAGSVSPSRSAVAHCAVLAALAGFSQGGSMSCLAFGFFSGRISQHNPLSRCCGGNSTPNPQSTGIRRASFALAFAGVALLAAASLPAFAQAGPAVTTGRPTDWTHHHLVFSDPGPAADERAKENDFHSQDVRNSTRYALQQMRRDPSQRPSVSPGSGPRVDSTSSTHLDWSENLSTGLVNPNTFPAKFSFNTNAYSCTSDYIVYPTGIAGSGTTQATIVAYNELYGTSGPAGTGCGGGTQRLGRPQYLLGLQHRLSAGLHHCRRQPRHNLACALPGRGPGGVHPGQQQQRCQPGAAEVGRQHFRRCAEHGRDQCDRRELSRLHRSMHDQDHV